MDTPRMVKRCQMPDCNYEVTDKNEKYCASCLWLKALIMLKAVNG